MVCNNCITIRTRMFFLLNSKSKYFDVSVIQGLFVALMFTYLPTHFVAYDLAVVYYLLRYTLIYIYRYLHARRLLPLW